MVPFTREVFLRLFEHYNAAIWPVQVVAYGLGFLVILLILRPRPGSDRVVAAVLAGSWLWTGVVYHAMTFATINWAGSAFAALFVIQGLLVAWTGTLRGRFRFRFVADFPGWCGLGFVVYAMAVHPLVGWLTGYGWPRAPMFGVAPAPTALFTLGVLLLAAPRVPWHLLAIPVLWTLVGGATAWLLALPQDLVLPLAGASAVGLGIWRNRRSSDRGQAGT